MVLTEKQFKDLIESHLEWDNRISEISNVLNCDIFDTDWIDYTHRLFYKVCKYFFTPEEYDTIIWWMYEHTDKEEDAMWDENGNVIPMKTIDDLYNYIKNDTKES